jgi:hypothetical protein
MVPPSTLPSPTLLSRIRDPPPPLSLYHRISPPTEPLSLEETIEICKATLGDGPRVSLPRPPPTPSPPGQNPPPPTFSTSQEIPTMTSMWKRSHSTPPSGLPSDPHYVCFDLDFESHQHYVLGLRDDSDPPHQAYGWPLQAAPFIGPKISPARSDNSALGIFDAGYPGAIEVDIALYELRDYGVLADVDRYRAHMLEYENLLSQCKILEDKFFKWRSKSTPLRQRLEKAQARSRLHPYLQLGERITCPFHYRTAPFPEPQTFSMAQCLLIDVESGDRESLRPKTAGASNTPSPTLPSVAAVHTVTLLTTIASLAPALIPNVTPPSAASCPAAMPTMEGVATPITFTSLRFPYP